MAIEHTIIMSDSGFDLNNPVAPEGFDDVINKRIARIHIPKNEQHKDKAISFTADVYFTDDTGLRFVDHITAERVAPYPELDHQIDLVPLSAIIQWFENLRMKEFATKKVNAAETAMAGVISSITNALGLELEQGLAKNFLELTVDAGPKNFFQKTFQALHIRHFNKYASDMLVFVAGNKFDVSCPGRDARGALNAILAVKSLLGQNSPAEIAILEAGTDNPDFPQLEGDWPEKVLQRVRQFHEKNSTN